MMVQYAGQDNEIKLDVISDGWWAIDKIAAKRLMRITLESKDSGMKLSYVPTTQDIVDIITKYLGCENANDVYVFPNGSKRPQELHKKIAELKEAFKKFEPTKMDEIF